MQQHSATTTTATNIAVVSREGCVQCNATYRTLTKAGVEYTVDIDADSADHALALSLGHQQAPVVLVRDSAGVLLDHWSGFRPDKISELADEWTPFDWQAAQLADRALAVAGSAACH